jgi:DNA-binding FadR family transcriptional regulator
VLPEADSDLWTGGLNFPQARPRRGDGHEINHGASFRIDPLVQPIHKVVQPIVPTTNLADDIFRDLRRRILAGALAAGERLPAERDLAAKYKTNRNTLREAIRMLEQSRLVTVRQGQGVTVADFRQSGSIELLAPFLEHAADDEEKVRVLCDVLPGRIQIIEIALSTAAARATPDDHVRLQKIVTEQLAAFAEGDVRKLELAHHRWLDALVDAAHSIPIRWVGNSFLEAAQGLFDRFPNMWLLEPTFPTYQSETMKALLARDSAWAVASARSYHVRVDRAMQDMLRALLGAKTETVTKQLPRKRRRKP